jgi:hypothetical protein
MLVLNMRSQGLIDQGLVVATTSQMNLLSKPCQHVIINPDSDMLLKYIHICMYENTVLISRNQSRFFDFFLNLA